MDLMYSNTFVVSSTDSHSSTGNTKFVKREREIFKNIDNTYSYTVIKLT